MKWMVCGTGQFRAYVPRNSISLAYAFNFTSEIYKQRLWEIFKKLNAVEKRDRSKNTWQESDEIAYMHEPRLLSYSHARHSIENLITTIAQFF